MPKVTLMCHPEAEPKDLANEKEILRFAQNDSFAVTLGTLVHFRHFTISLKKEVLWHTQMNQTKAPVQRGAIS